MLDEADRVLKLDDTPQLLSYDTTFLLGDFYVSPLVFRHTVFREKPCIPVMFLLHERKFKETHQDMFRECAKHIPSLKKTRCPLVTDREQAIVYAVNSELPEIPLVHCWNHLFRDIQLWLAKHGAPSSDKAVYTDDVSKLFQAESEDQYKQLLDRFRQDWDSTFEQYYLRQIHVDVPKSVGRWVLEKLRVYNPYSGVTNNQSEGLNRVMKELQRWKEAPIDCMLLALYHLQAFYLNEIRRGLAGTGEYHLTEEYDGRIQSYHETTLYISCSSPEEIVLKIKQSASLDNAPSTLTIDPEAEENTSKSLPRIFSAHARAKQVLESDNISFDPKLHVFNVKGSSGNTRVVTIFPQESCSCPSKSGCYHIMAVKMSIGVDLVDKPSTRNLTQLRKNTRSRKDKRSGRKRPRAADTGKFNVRIMSVH